jgi:hypothetical protein
VLIINKPAGLNMQPGPGRFGDRSIDALRQGLKLVHFPAQSEPFVPLKLHPKYPLNTSQGLNTPYTGPAKLLEPAPKYPLNIPYLTKVAYVELESGRVKVPALRPAMMFGASEMPRIVHRLGRAVQVDPIKPTLTAPGSERWKL